MLDRIRRIRARMLERLARFVGRRARAQAVVLRKSQYAHCQAERQRDGIEKHFALLFISATSSIARAPRNSGREMGAGIDARGIHPISLTQGLSAIGRSYRDLS